MKNIIVFGATGSIGVYTCTLLKEQGYNVIAVGRRKTDNGFFQSYNIPYYSVDIKNKSEFDKLPADIDSVIHLAGAMPAHMKGYDPYEYIDYPLAELKCSYNDIQKVAHVVDFQ